MSFTDPQAVMRYVDGVVRQVPGLHVLHQMAGLLLHECVPPDGRVLVLGAGGGIELKVFAETYPQWRLLGVDPSPQMLELAARTLGPLAPRVELLEGYIDAAPATEFDGAACLLTFHFLSVEERLYTLRELKRRLKPGAPLVIAHHSVPDTPGERMRWLQRHVAFITSNGVPVANGPSAIGAIASHLHLLSPESEVELLERAGFERPSLFYAAFTFKGWVAYAAR
ncbi:class I SAM-dependent methyltransferase [Rhodanobacter denitrificans]|uniref:class I SAM-dependent methyltransferase n=1 Tax=Rhodanobacter denitrificans TaxID=666685 RepID=UPI001F337E90|nr:class I SAM-dependent methyltransferase [Rhodanobacter denitrificans]UJJ60224.1 class I SAM-dependent methyltransferase [Rhodanobacter denitrificans]